MRERLYDFYYLTKPGIIYGNLIHTLAGSLLAVRYGLDVVTITGVLAGTSAVIASACVVNNYIDRGIDARMARTKKRALVNGRINDRDALIFAGALAIVGFWLLSILTNLYVVAIGFVAYLFYVVIYGYAKRNSVHSTLIGSIPGALPPMAGYVAVSGTIDSSAWLIFFLIVCWQMPHFYAISVFRREEYKAAGLPVLGVVAPLAVVKTAIAIFMISYVIVIATLNNNGTISTLPTFLLLAGAGYWGIVFSRPADTSEAWARRIFKVSLVLAILLLVAGVCNVVLA